MCIGVNRWIFLKKSPNVVLTSVINLCIDLQWWEMRSKMAARGHFVEKKIKVGYWSEISRNAIKSDFRSSKMAASCHFVKKIQRKINCVLICNGDKCDWKWFSVIQNGRQRPFCEKNSKKRKAAYWSAMVRNAIKSDFQSSKMSARGYFVKKKLGIDLKYREMWLKVIFGHPKWEQNQSWVFIWNSKNEIKSDFRSSKLAACDHCVNFFK